MSTVYVIIYIYTIYDDCDDAVIYTHVNAQSDCLGCVVLLCFVVCMTLLASFFLPSSSLINMLKATALGVLCCFALLFV